MAVTRFGLPPELHVPIAAVDEAALRRHVGAVTPLAPGRPRGALLVEPPDVPREGNLRIWRLPEAGSLHPRRQVWVHVDDPAYRKAYLRGFPDARLDGKVIDHVMNRRAARILGYDLLRVVPISRAANSSSGAGSEAMGVAYQRSRGPPQRPPRGSIRHADLADLVKMLDRKTGGAPFDPINEAQSLLLPEP